jgi:hypothetical protein
VSTWGGKTSNIFKGVSSYEEALRRIRNKTRDSKKIREEADAITGNGLGFMGFQPKMVSMLVYFIDWENLLKEQFIYPTPADFHNFRFGLALRIIVLNPQPVNIRSTELISKPWRDLTIRYLEARKGQVTPVELADAIWLFSLESCGNSPLTDYHEREDKNGHGMFDEDHLPHSTKPDFMAPRFRERLKRTCLGCSLLDICELGIPAGPYYQRRGDRDVAFGGQLYLADRFPIEWHLPAIPIDYLPQKPEELKHPQIFDDLHEHLVPDRPTEIPDDFFEDKT